ncbi:hypothetical protein DAMA08_004860 [Martiniozyma asiatica (nom. inval.)]|nr:hypothetical protein DAMA08_004860 [Martiniozyma asiatica]
MKLALLALVGAALASYQNSAPLLKSGLTDSVYLCSANDAAAAVEKVTSKLCTSDSVVFLKIHGLNDKDLTSEFLEYFDLSVMADNVVYNDDTMLPLSKHCQTTFIDTANASNDEEWIEELLKADSAIIDLYKNSQLNLADSLQKLSIVASGRQFIIQGVPTFENPDTVMGNLKYVFSSQKRDEMDIDFEKVENTIKESINDVNSYIERENVEATQNEYKEIPYASVSGKSTANDNGGLFDKYTFFTPGIWMATIVSLFLFFLLSTALSWLSSMKISYKAFDKPFDFEKKLS